MLKTLLKMLKSPKPPPFYFYTGKMDTPLCQPQKHQFFLSTDTASNLTFTKPVSFRSLPLSLVLCYNTFQKAALPFPDSAGRQSAIYSESCRCTTRLFLPAGIRREEPFYA